MRQWSNAPYKEQKMDEPALDPAHIHTHDEKKNNKIQSTHARTHSQTHNGWREVDEMALALYVAMPIVNGIRSEMPKLTSSHDCCNAAALFSRFAHTPLASLFL